MRPGRFDYDGPMNGSHEILGFIMGVLILAALVALAIYAIRTFSNHSRLSSGTRDPLDIARERYAKGEITREELVDIRKELK